MALPCPGPSPISLLDIQNEFGGANPIGVDEYYRGGLYVPNTTGNANIPTSGTISFDKFFCSAAELVIFITTNTANLDVRALFEATYPGSWTSGAQKRLVINSGVIVYNTNPYIISNLNGYALRIYDTFNGTFTLQNFGSIQGAAGRRGGDDIIAGESRTDASNGGQGGNAIYIGPTTYGATANSRTVSIDNGGTIYAGGGGGGQGGSIAGGTINYIFRSFGSCCPFDASINSAAAVGGLGGWGQGYNQSNTAGAGGNSSRKTITVSMTSIANNDFIFPSNSDITITANISVQKNHKFSSSSSITYNMNGSPTESLTFAGSNNSISLSRNQGSPLSTLFKDPNQNYTDQRDSSSPAIGSVQNVSGIVDQDPDYVVLKANSINQTFSVPGSSGSGGSGATWGNTGVSSGSAGGPPGYAIVGRSTYVSYITQGTIAGLTN